MLHVALVLPLMYGLSQNPQKDSLVTAPQVMQHSLVARAEEPEDPGKAITDDPHGNDPHGRDPHDQIHDDKMPANNKDPYGNPKP